jgi:NADH-quinone oxidoreductase subunit L
MTSAPWFILLAPIAGFFILMLGSRLPKAAISVVGPAAVGVGFVGAVWMLLWDSAHHGAQSDNVAYTWIVSGGFKVLFGALIDPLSTVMCLIVTGVGFLIMIYSVGYMHEDIDYRRFFCYMDLFVFAMLLLVLSDNYLFLLVGWAGVGLTSYLLIGFWYDRPTAVTAARQALVVNVIGDWGVMIAAFVLLINFHSLQYTTIFPGVTHTLSHDGTTVRIITLLLLVGAVAKSAQLPLHVWLPNAMEGPTPVSALIHAATMVTAGVYLIARSYPLYHWSPFTCALIVIIGAAGAVFAATCALTNNDIKRVLAYSTMSQIAYMFVGVGSAAYATGIFHLTTHAYFKALLFMGAGAVMHATHDNVDIRRMGGLKSKMPFTFWTFLIGTLALSGIPPFSGFFSKDDIIGAIFDQAQHTAWLWIIWALLILTAGLTALYMFRLIFLVFFGQEREPALNDHAHDPSLIMKVPMAILAFLAITGGYVAIPGAKDVIGDWLGHTFTRYQPVAPPLPATQVVSLVVAALAALAGIFVAWRVWYKHEPEPARAAAAFPAGYRLFANRWYIDAIYDAFIVKPILGIGASFNAVVERFLINGIVDGSALALRGGSGELRKAQTGYVRAYAFTILLGAVLIVGFYVVHG